jgi:transcriptional regulator GlxA family with amidase domain
MKILLFCVLFAASLTLAHTGNKKMNVAIFIYDGVEILDFSGPGEVFAATVVDSNFAFNVYTVAVNKNPILSQGFVTVTPQYSIDDCPKPDILVLPGGSTGNSVRNEKLIKWVKNISEDTKITMSVCTGAMLLSKAGLLDGKECTTWHGAIDRLQKITPKTKVHKNTRFVDNGHIVTTAGVSAGIDGALHVVSRLFGEEKAKEAAYYMEYDKWKPKEGLIVSK